MSTESIPQISIDGPTVELPALEGLPVEVAAEGRPCYAVSEAMLAAAPSTDPLRTAYQLGVVAATVRRVHPATAPQAFPFQMDVPRDSDSLIDGEIKVDDLPYLASPVVELVRTYMPDLTMAADRGGRLFALAVYGVWHRRYGGAPFPTIDGTIHFGRISKKIDQDATRRVVEHILHRSGVMAELAQRQAEGDQSPLRVLFLDDWIHEGRTVEHVEQLIAELAAARGQNVELAVGTMRGTQHHRLRHVVGDTRREHGKGAWTDDSRIIGVDYDASGYSGVEGRVVRGQGSASIRSSLQAAIRAKVQPPTEAPVQTERSWYRRLLG